MATCSIICEMRIKWWVRPMIALLKVWAVVTRKAPDAGKLGDFIARRGIKKNMAIELQKEE